MKIRCSTNQNTSKSIKAAKLSQRSLQKKGRNRYTIMYSEVYNAPDADPREMFHEFEAQITVSNPYDDADYVWASISNGVVNYIRNGKVIDKSYYMTADDIDVENDEWCDVVIEQVLENLESYNSKVESRIIHSSSDIRSKTQDNGYWFFTRHGVQPGSVPKDVEILDIMDTPNGTFVKLNRFLSTKELDYYDLVEKAPESITSDEDVFDDIKEIGQEFTSENTSINSKKLPAIFNMVTFNPGTVNLDYGGGRFNNVAEYLKQYDVINLVYDPYNRSSEHNQEVIRLIREHGGADTATCSNVLNVIKEPEVRLNVLKNISKLVKSGGTVYITVYGGKGNSSEGPTKSGYQLNRKTADYLEEIQQVFPDAKRKGKLIVCSNSNSVTSSITAMEDSMIDPPDYEEPDMFDEEFELEIDLTGVVVKVEDDTLDLDESSIEITPDSGDDDFVNDYGMYIDDISGVEEKILDLVQKDIPDAEGKYKLSGYAYLIYNVEGLEMYTERYGEDDFEETVYTDRAKKSYDASKSYTKNLTVRKMI